MRGPCADSAFGIRPACNADEDAALASCPPARCVVVALSAVVNGLAAMPYWTYWNTNPLKEAADWAWEVAQRGNSS